MDNFYDYDALREEAAQLLSQQYADMTDDQCYIESPDIPEGPEIAEFSSFPSQNTSKKSESPKNLPNRSSSKKEPSKKGTPKKNSSLTPKKESSSPQKGVKPIKETVPLSEEDKEKVTDVKATSTIDEDGDRVDALVFKNSQPEEEPTSSSPTPTEEEEKIALDSHKRENEPEDDEETTVSDEIEEVEPENTPEESSSEEDNKEVSSDEFTESGTEPLTSEEPEEDPDIEVIPPEEEPFVEPASFPGDDVIDMEIDDEEDKEGVHLNKALLIKVGSFVAMLVILIGIPLLLSFMLRGSSDKDESTSRSEEVTTSAAIISSSNTGNIIDDVTNDAYSSLEKSNTSTRFETLDDLIFYLDSNISSTLADEKVLVTTYKNGDISYEYYLAKGNEYVEFTDYLSHLLTANKKIFEDENRRDEYDELVESLDALMIYGDAIVH